ncbi:MAG: DUF3450 family protein [Verrucomicrobiota bacterium]
MFQKRLLIVSAFAVAGSTLFSSSITDTQDELISWVETRKAISETKAEWAAEKQIVSDLIQLLEIEKEKYETGIEELGDSDNATDKLRTELNADKERLLAANEALETFMPDLESKVKSLLSLLPEPLVQELDPLIRRLPEEDAKTRMPVSQRLLTVVGVLNKIDKFNTGITIKSEIRSVGGGSSEVTTLYFGLSGAYFSNDSGSYAGTGTPGPDGWVWTEDSSIANDIVALIKSYEGASEAKFVELPVKAL